MGQIALALAQRYDPAAAQQLGMVLQGVAADMGTAPMLTAGGGKPNLAPDDEMSAAHDPKESALVRRAAERTANASRPD